MSHRLDSMQSQRTTATHTITSLAKKANVSDFTIIRLENGGATDPNTSQRIADALGVSLATLGKSDL